MTFSLTGSSVPGSGGNATTDTLVLLNDASSSSSNDHIVGPYGLPPPSASDALSTDAGAAVYLTPDALLAYCQARLDSIDGQVEGSMAEQQLRNGESSAIQTALQKLQQYTSGVNNDSGACTATETSLYNLIKSIGATDPGCPELGKLTQTYNDLVYSGTGATAALPYIDEASYAPVPNGPEGDNTLGSSEMQTFISNLQGCASDLNSGSELQMIQLQSLMSQRQTAIQLTTNLVQSLGDQAEKIAENVGH